MICNLFGACDFEFGVFKLIAIYYSLFTVLMKRVLTYLTILIVLAGGTYLISSKTEQAQNAINKTQMLLGYAKEKVKATPIKDLIVNKPSEEDLSENHDLTTSAWIPYWDQNRGFEIALNNSDKLDSVSPVWFYVNGDGSLTERNLSNFAFRVGEMRGAGIQIVPTVTNPSSEEFSLILNNDQTRARHIQNIVNAVERYEFDGIDLDYENLEASDRTIFSQFIKELSEELHSRNKLLTIAVLPKTDNIIYQFSASRQAQDYEAIGTYVDEFRIMAYDWSHNSTTEAGAVSPSYWIEEVVRYALGKVESSKVVLGAPLYGYYWQGAQVSALTWEDAQELINNGGENIWDTSTQENQIIVGNYEAWYHDARTIEARRAIAARYGIKGVVYWRLGGEDPDIWKL